VTAGSASREVLRIARERAAELVVMGVQGSSALHRLFFGSTTHRVVRDAPCAVLAVRRMWPMRRAVPVGRLEGMLTAAHGLSSIEASERRQRYGGNDILEIARSPWWDLLRDTVKDPIIWFLGGLAAVSLPSALNLIRHPRPPRGGPGPIEEQHRPDRDPGRADARHAQPAIPGLDAWDEEGGRVAGQH